MIQRFQEPCCHLFRFFKFWQISASSHCSLEMCMSGNSWISQTLRFLKLTPNPLLWSTRHPNAMNMLVCSKHLYEVSSSALNKSDSSSLKKCPLQISVKLSFCHVLLSLNVSSHPSFLASFWTIRLPCMFSEVPVWVCHISFFSSNLILLSYGYFEEWKSPVCIRPEEREHKFKSRKMQTFYNCMI